MEIDIPDLNELQFEERCGPIWCRSCEPDCAECHGTGFKPNAVGRRLLDFLETHGFVQARKKD